MNSASPSFLVGNPDSEAGVRERERDRLLATVAHELRTPLMPIVSGALVLQRRGIDPELAQATARIIERQARLLGRLVDDLLDVSHAKLGTVELQRRRVSMSEIVESCTQTMAGCISDRGQRLQVTISPDSMELDADATRLCQALQNLIANSAKFSERGGMIRVSAARDRRDVVVVVDDDGVGIDPDHLESIFTLYTQIGVRAVHGHGAGLGIGLYLARRFVEAHGGTLVATSAGVGSGSSFTMRIPCPGFPLDAEGVQWERSSRSVSALTTA